MSDLVGNPEDRFSHVRYDRSVNFRNRGCLRTFAISLEISEVIIFGIELKPMNETFVCTISLVKERTCGKLQAFVLFGILYVLWG